jgi:hypothetical protein
MYISSGSNIAVPIACYQRGISRPTSMISLLIPSSALYRITLHCHLAFLTTITISYGLHLILSTCTNPGSLEHHPIDFSGVLLVQRNDAKR